MPHHHLWYNHHNRYRMFCGPSRLIWFGVGSVVTYAFMRHHRDLDHGQVGGFCRPRFEQRRAQWESDGAPPPLSPPSGAASPNHGQWQQTRDWRPMEQGQGAGAGAPIPGTHVVPPGGPEQREPAAQQQQQQKQDSLPVVTDRDYERLRQMGRSAEETISGMSEATIDSMMTGLQRLKEKLAERRGQESGSQPWSQQVNPTRATSEPPPRHQV